VLGATEAYLIDIIIFKTKPTKVSATLMAPSIIALVGKPDSGKTTLLEKLIPELSRRGYRIGTVKHHVHEFEMDREPCHHPVDWA
jgi:Ni2+-binding GTPase involved in maturation of urease and hydrogenase